MPVVRILIFHGYLLRGTGSNIYNASLVAALAKLGHEVHLLCQDHRAADLDVIDATGDWDTGELRVEVKREPARVTAYRPPIGRILPVYVADDYEDFDAKPFSSLSDAELDAYLDANVAAARDLVARLEPDVALANHLVMGPVILARALSGAVPYAVKVHGSALEYTVKPESGRFLTYAREGLDSAAGVLVGSRHTAESLWEAIGDPHLPERTRLGPPGVDVEQFRPSPPQEAAGRLSALADRLEGVEADWGGASGAAGVLASLNPARDRIVSYVGKLIVSKGVELLIAAWPLVSARIDRARLVIVGFGTYDEGLRQLCAALAAGSLAEAREIAARGRELEGGDTGELEELAAFLDSLTGAERDAYVAAARDTAGAIVFTGRLEHADLPDLLCACEAQVVPSTFPEAFGMVAAEAATTGTLPVSARHSGLGEVSALLEPALEPDLRDLLGFDLDGDAVRAIADRLVRWLELDPGRRTAARESLSKLARGRFGWRRVAENVIAAAEGRLDDLDRPIE